ncbi:MAG: glycosyltransferase family 39 protein [Ardenticatenaceae bacterium]|nr:glycosyltransferase family 39 protein [Ardenticatenaceae bacterium]
METALKSERINIFSRLTVADGLTALLAVGAAIMRFVDLGKLPLSPAEAAEAWSVWQFWQPGGAGASASPAYFSLTSLLLPLLGDSDTVMRLVPALVGLGIVFLPWLLRRQLGTVGTLTAVTLLTISPIQAIVSRTAGGDTLALLAILFMLVAMLRYDESKSSRWFIALFAGLALGLISSPLFYGGLAILLMATRSGWRRRLADIDGKLGRRTAVTTLALFFALSTLVLWHLPGLGAAAMLPATWIMQFDLNPAQMFEPVLAFIRYEPFLTLMGVTAVFWAIRSDNSLAKQLARWMGLVFVLLLLQPGQMNNAALLTLPIVLLVSLMADRLLQTPLDRIGQAWTGGALLLGGLFFVNLARFSRVVTLSPQEFSSVWIMLMAVTAGLMTIYFLSTWEGTAASTGSTAVLQGAFLALLAFSAFYQWGTGWWLSHEAANDPRERWVTQATDNEIRLLVTTLQDVSWQANNANYGLDIFSSVDSPTLRWYLRHFQKVQFGNSLPVSAQNQVIISPYNAELSLGSDYAGADFGILRDGLLPSEFPSPTPSLDILRWWLFHESSLATNEERVILWWRTDLSKEG